jgi:hypothetical protein
MERESQKKFTYVDLVDRARVMILMLVDAAAFGELVEADLVGDAVRDAIAELRDAGEIEQASGPSDRQAGYGFGQHRATRARWARRLAEYALEFEESSPGPDVDALAERFDELLGGRPVAGGERHPCTRRDRDGPPLPPTTRDSAPADIDRELADELSLLVRDCFSPVKGWDSRRVSIRERAIHIYRRFRALGRLPPEAVALLDFVHAELLKEAVPPRGGQPVPHA